VPLVASVVIPAHDEAAVIERCLSRLVPFGPDPTLDVVVVANGCSDDTADRARRAGARVLETDEPGKGNALNLGDSSCSAFPRVYLDADVVLTHDDLMALVRQVARPGVLAGAPRMAWNPTGTSWAVRAYYRVWTALPYVTRGLLGSGVYALSAEGRARFDAFPTLVGDDTFVRSLFAERERSLVHEAVFTVHPPRTLRSLLAVKTRVWSGNELHDPAGLPARAGGTSGPSAATVLLGRPELWPAVPVYAAVYVAARLNAKRRMRVGTAGTWDRDLTSRPEEPTT
jgi:glycosyltransferase involved in cell wall biosynthesis